MSVTRRAVLGALLLSVGGCTTGPFADEDQAPAPASLHPESSAATEALRALDTALARLEALTAWPHQRWTAGARSQCRVHLTRLSLSDPLNGEGITASPAPATPATGVEAGRAALEKATDQARAALIRAAKVADEGSLRLAYWSAATATAALSNRTRIPSSGTGTPHRLQPTAFGDPLPVALSHVWALTYGLGIGLGRLSAKDSLHAAGAARLAAVQALRTELRDKLGDTSPLQPAAFRLPTPMRTRMEITKAWVRLETGLLNGYARLVAADDDPRWGKRMTGQVMPIQSLGGTLPYWPGWTR